jgi:5-methylcytosine-specific restriction protein A
MSYPPYDELEMPLLKLIYEIGGLNFQIHATDAYAPLAKHFDLSETERKQSRNDVNADGRDEPHWNNMIQWARRKLNEQGYLSDSPRGYWKLSEFGITKAKPLATGNFLHISYPDEIVTNTTEGAKSKVVVNSYERSSIARQKCIDQYGYSCSVCSMNFESIYGERGKHFIHVHHIVPISSIGETYVVDPITDLRPICPNCHAIIHRTDPPCSIDDAKTFLNTR